MLGKFIAGDFIAIAGEMRRFPASNENTAKAVFFIRADFKFNELVKLDLKTPLIMPLFHCPLMHKTTKLKKNGINSKCECENLKNKFQGNKAEGVS
jgi:hypothetical protein